MTRRCGRRPPPATARAAGWAVAASLWLAVAGFGTGWGLPRAAGQALLGVISPYYLYADMVRGAEGARGPAGEQTNVFRRGEQVVWRAVVMDVFQGEAVMARPDLQVTVVVVGGPRLEMRPAPPGAGDGLPHWFAVWQIPPNQAPGVYRWWVEVADTLGQTGRFDPIAIVEEPTTGGLVILP